MNYNFKFHILKIIIIWNIDTKIYHKNFLSLNKLFKINSL